MPITTAVSANTFSPSSLVARAKPDADWASTLQQRAGIEATMGNQNAKRVELVQRFTDRNGLSNPPFRYNQYVKVPNGIKNPQITRGYIRRSDLADDVGGASLNFMFNPEQITRDYVSYLDQAALDPFNTLYQSGNLVAPPSFVNFNFSLFFDRQDDLAADPKDSRGVLVDYEFFDLVVRNVVPSVRGVSDVPDNGVMMVNPKDITVVFSKDLTVQGRPTNARVTFAKFDHRMVPIRMQIDLTMIITYFGPLRSAFGLNTFRASKQYEALVPYSDTLEEGFTTADLELATKTYQDQISKQSATAGSTSGNWFSEFVSNLNTSVQSTILSQLGGAAGGSSGANGDIRGAAADAAAGAAGAGYSGDLRAGSDPSKCSCIIPGGGVALLSAMPTGQTYDASGLVWSSLETVGAGKVLAGTAYAPTTAAVVEYQQRTNWATMPVLVNGGERTSVVRGAARSALEKGDVLIRWNAGRGHMAFFKEWADEDKTTAVVVESLPGVGVAENTVGIDYVCDFNWMTRPTLAGSQSLARGIA